tara:strand:+ start:247 stop:486 length:240 start_codon:yes stop_codon:yes gene_type:complete
MIEFSFKEKEALMDKIQKYMNDELDVEIGQFDAGFLLDFMTEQIGPAFYNKGVQDAQQVLDEKLDDIRHALYEIEKPVV